MADSAKRTLIVTDENGSPIEGEFFVIDLINDEHAAIAIWAYANACAKTNPELAAEILAKLG